MPHFQFFWTPLRLEKIELNGVDREDVEYVIMNPLRTELRRTSGRPMAFGDDPTGRPLACVYVIESDGLTVHPITAYYLD